MAARRDTIDGVHKALNHPLRRGILLDLKSHKTRSPTAFRSSLGQDVALNVIAYHFHVLMEFEAIELVATVQRGAATEHVYRLNQQSEIGNHLQAAELLQRLTSPEVEPVHATANPGEAVVILPIDVDDSGQKELQEILATFSARIDELRARCGARILRSAKPPKSFRVGVATYLAGGAGSAPPIVG